MHRVLITAIVAAVCVMTPAVAFSQMTLFGRASEVSTGAALRCFSAELMDREANVVDSTETVRRGDFQLTAPAPGQYRVRLRLQGVTEVISQPLTFPRPSAERVAFRLPIYVDVHVLDSIVTDTSSRELIPDRRSRGPYYPQDMLEAGQEGSVVMVFTIQPDGRVDRSTAFPLHASHPSFLRAVLESLPTLRYRLQDFPSDRPCAAVSQLFAFKLQR